MAGGLGLFGYVFSEVALYSCFYFAEGLGITSFYYCGYTSCYCTSYADFGFFIYQGAHSAALAFGVLATIFGLVAFIVSFCAACRAFRKGVFIFLGTTYTLCAVFNLLTLVMFAECGGEATCTFGAGAACAIVAAAFWIGSAVCSFLTPKYKNDEPVPIVLQHPTPIAVIGQSAPQPIQAVTPGTVTITETVQPDGKILTEKVTENYDGSKTVETFLKNPEPASS